MGIRQKTQTTLKNLKDRVRPNPPHPSQTHKNSAKLLFYASICLFGTVGINLALLETVGNMVLGYGVAFIFFLASFYLFEKKSKEVDNPHECDYCYRDIGRKSLSRTIMEINDGFKMVYLCDDCYVKNMEQGELYKRDDIKLKPLTWSYESRVDG